MITSFALMLFGGVTVTLPEKAQITGTEITVGQVAQVTGDDASEVERVQAASLGYAPAPGYTRVLLAPRIANRISQSLGLELGSELSIVGADRCVVTPLSHRVTAEELRAKAARVHANKSGKGRRHERRAVTALAPRGDLQERVLGPLPFLARYGPDLVDALFEHVSPYDPRHVLATIEVDG